MSCHVKIILFAHQISLTLLFRRRCAINCYYCRYCRWVQDDRCLTVIFTIWLMSINNISTCSFFHLWNFFVHMSHLIFCLTESLNCNHCSRSQKCLPDLITNRPVCVSCNRPYGRCPMQVNINSNTYLSLASRYFAYLYYYEVNILF